MKISIYTLLLSVAILHGPKANAQIIHLSLPEQANTGYTLYFNKGQQKETILSGKTDASGKARLTIPTAQATYKGMAHLELGTKKNIQFIVNKENFSIQSRQAKIQFLYSKENQYMNQLAAENKQEIKGASYAPIYHDILLYTQRLQRLQQNQSVTEIPALRTYLSHKLDMDALYTSGLWNLTISGTFGLYPDKQAFGQDMVAAMKRTRTQEAFNALADDLITICEQFGWLTAEDTILAYLASSKRLTNPSPTLRSLLAAQQVKPGSPAPMLEGYPKQPARQIIFFYESGCSNCEAELAEAMKHYSLLQKKGIEVVSVSADNDKEVHDYHAGKFPWKYKLCDTKEFEGVNFKRYGVVATPTIYLIDENGKIAGRYAKLSETKLIP